MAVSARCMMMIELHTALARCRSYYRLEFLVYLMMVDTWALAVFHQLAVAFAAEATV